MRLFAPWPVTIKDSRDATVAVVIEILKDVLPNEKAIYLSIDGQDADEEILHQLRAVLPKFRLLPFSQHVPTEGQCFMQSINNATSNLCADDVLKIKYLSMPLWHTAIMHTHMGSCAHELTLFKFATTWYVISNRRLCA